MGKSKSKKSQPKRYPTPEDKYLIVTDPWGGVPISDPNFFNNVTAWFEIMFKPKYPGVRPSAIFYQWTNKNIVVEIPDHIDVEPYLGAHYWSTFLVPPHCYEVGTRASFIYEFETRFFPIPVNQGGWTPGYAKYTRILDNFDVREPYPDPHPAPNSTLSFAKKLPQYKVVPANQPVMLAPPEFSPARELDDEELMPPPPLPVSPKAKLLNKVDPYEEEEAAKASLRDTSLNSLLSLSPFQCDPRQHQVKQEIATNDLEDVKPKVKAEETGQNDNGGYQPTEEWMKVFASLQQDEEEQKPSSSNDYVPSEDLLMALSSLPEGMVEINSSSSSHTMQPKVKAEPQDDDIIPLSRSRSSFPSRNTRGGSMTLRDDDSTSTLRRNNHDVRVKREGSDQAYDDPPRMAKKVKLEP